MADTEESQAQRQARLRREKREKKILEGGSARLEKITGVSGRSVALEPPSSPPKPATKPESPPPPVSANETRAALAPAEARPPKDTRPAPRQSATPDDSDQQQQQDLMQQLQQLLSGMPPPGGSGASPFGVPPTGADGDPAANLPPGLASLFSGGPTTPQAPPRSTYLWKLLHLITSVALGAYFLWAYAFTGAARHIRRDTLQGSTSDAEGVPSIDFAGLKNDRITVFSLFASVELALQSARYLLSDRSAETAGMVGTVANFLPSPWGSRLRLANQYLGIWTTLVGDAMVVIFVLGMGAWWSGTA